MATILYKDESYAIVGAIVDVYNNLGSGFSEIVYKDALAYEFTHLNIPFESEKEFRVAYKDVFLKHKFYADFVLFDEIIFEKKFSADLNDTHVSQCINYLEVSECKLEVFHKNLLDHKRIVL